MPSSEHTLMTTRTRLHIVCDNPPSASRSFLADRLAALGAYLSACAKTCADYYEAATLYEQLSCLSDAELRRRGVSSATLGWDIARGCDRANG
jgi:hypothetical protein